MLHVVRVRTERFSRDGQRVVTASEDKTAQLWDCPTFGHKDSADDVRMLADLAEATSDLAFAHNCVGSVWESLDESSRAVKEYEESLAIAEKLVMLDSTNILWQQDLIDFKRQIEHVRG